jgi:hypothetical protein
MEPGGGQLERKLYIECAGEPRTRETEDGVMLDLCMNLFACFRSF